MTNKAKKAALRDIKADLSKSSKTFITFRTSLNPVIDRIVENYLKRQEETRA